MQAFWVKIETRTDMRFASSEVQASKTRNVPGMSFLFPESLSGHQCFVLSGDLCRTCISDSGMQNVVGTPSRGGIEITTHRLEEDLRSLPPQGVLPSTVSR